jgi:hypothetical protein
VLPATSNSSRERLADHAFERYVPVLLVFIVAPCYSPQQSTTLRALDGALVTYAWRKKRDLSLKRMLRTSIDWSRINSVMRVTLPIQI